MSGPAATGRGHSEHSEAEAPEPEGLGAEGRALGSRIRVVLGYIAPTTMITSLLVYFGFIGTTARFKYFGVPLETLDLSNQDLTLYGLEVVYVPALLVLVAVLAAIFVHAAVTWTLSRPDGPWRAWAAAGLAAVAGLLLIARGLMGVLISTLSERETPGTSGLCLAVGPALLVYATWVAVRAASPGPFLLWATSPRTRRLRTSATVCASALFVIGSFWAANSFAWAYGLTRGYQDALALADNRPEVVLDSKFRLPAPQAGPAGMVREQWLAEGNEFRFRYWGLRVLTESGGRLFLVPGEWRAGSSTLVVPYDGTVRMRLVPGPP